MEAAYKGDADLVDLLLEYGADINIVTHDGLTAKMIARQEGYDDIAELLSTDED